MPKVIGTRQQKATELVQQVNRGPALHLTFFNDVELTSSAKKLIEVEMINQYRLWAETWIVPELLKLIPELRSK